MSYRVEYTEVKPGGHLDRQNDLVRGTLSDVRDYIDSRRVHGADPIVVAEFTESDSVGRLVPASEWDI